MVVVLREFLNELESCNFIEAFGPINNQKKGTLYRLTDEYSRFYLHFIEKGNIKNFQTFSSTSKVFSSWQGYAYETLCIKHMEAIKLALQIGGVNTNVYSFFKAANRNTKGFQIDALLDRADNVINLCEVKFYNKELKPDKKFVEALRNKRARFIEYSGTKKNCL